MRKILWLSVLIFLPFISEARNQVSGYISLKSLGGNTYQATIVDYTLGLLCSVPTADTMRIWWGDGSSTLLNRSNGNGDSVCNCHVVNFFTGTHKYPGLGNYTLSFVVPDRNANIQNISNSYNQEMIIFNTLSITPYATTDSILPVITNPPVCTHGCLSQCYNFNLGAYSPAGDSLSYSLGSCLGDTSTYFIPSGVSVNPVTGELSWCNPDSLGLWNFSIRITTYNKVVISGHPTQIPVDTEEVELQVTIDSTCVTGSKEIINSAGEYTIYPNPSNGKFTLEALGVSSQSVVEIYNVLGERVYIQTIKIGKEDTPVNLVDKPSGLYLYRVLTETGYIVSEGKFIIQK